MQNPTPIVLACLAAALAPLPARHGPALDAPGHPSLLSWRLEEHWTRQGQADPRNRQALQAAATGAPWSQNRIFGPI